MWNLSLICSFCSILKYNLNLAHLDLCRGDLDWVRLRFVDTCCLVWIPIRSLPRRLFFSIKLISKLGTSLVNLRTYNWKLEFVCIIILDYLWMSKTRSVRRYPAYLACSVCMYVFGVQIHIVFWIFQTQDLRNNLFSLIGITVKKCIDSLLLFTNILLLIFYLINSIILIFVNRFEKNISKSWIITVHLLLFPTAKILEMIWPLLMV